MVQFQQRKEYSESYWKVGEQGGTIATLLRATERLGYRCKPGRAISMSRAFDLLSRAERGLLSYETLSKDELKRFCVQRGLQLPRKLTLSALTDIVEEADEDATFYGFLRLPPELRLIVLKQHMAWLSWMSRFEELLSRPVQQPPISRICRVIRKESLPIFNAMCRVRFTIRFENPTTWRAMKDYTQRFIRISAAHDISCVNRFTINWVFPIRRFSDEIFTLSVRLSHGTYTLDSEFAGGWTAGYNSRGTALIREECREIIRGIAAREGPHKLRKDDFLVLSQAAARGVYKWAAEGGF